MRVTSTLKPLSNLIGSRMNRVLFVGAAYLHHTKRQWRPQWRCTSTISKKRQWHCYCCYFLLRLLKIRVLLRPLGARLRSFIFGAVVSSSPSFLGDEPTNSFARSGHGAPAGHGRETLSEDTVSTRVALLVAREVSWSRACLHRCRS
jgi:hypothetical protein